MEEDPPFPSHLGCSLRLLMKRYQYLSITTHQYLILDRLRTKLYDNSDDYDCIMWLIILFYVVTFNKYQDMVLIYLSIDKNFQSLQSFHHFLASRLSLVTRKLLNQEFQVTKLKASCIKNLRSTSRVATVDHYGIYIDIYICFTFANMDDGYVTQSSLLFPPN